MNLAAKLDHGSHQLLIQVKEFKSFDNFIEASSIDFVKASFVVKVGIVNCSWVSCFNLATSNFAALAIGITCLYSAEIIATTSFRFLKLLKNI